MNSTAAAIQQQLDDGVIGIIGLGYVGLPLALRYAEVGYRVIGFDIDASKIAALNSGCSYISYIPDTAVEQARRGGFEAVCDYQRVAELSALIICVPTPLGKHLDPDLGFVRGTLDAVVPHIQAGQVIALESTTYPGTTEEEVVPRLRARGLEPGRDVFVVYSPEREDPGNPRYTTRAIPKVVGGYTPACLQVGLALYHRVIDQLVPVSSTRAAEMTKLLENIHRAVNIGLVNEMKLVAEKMGIDIFEVIDAAATKPFGFTPYYPGPGLGGHCIPIDPYYLTWKAREYGINTRFIELAGEVNRAMPMYTIQRLQEGLSAQSKALNGSRVLVLGIAYKKNVSDTRESPSIEMMDLLREKGADVAYSDPFVPIFPVKRDYAFDLCSEPLSAAKLAGFDAVLIGTDHDAFDYELIQSSAQLVVDTRGRYRSACANVIRA